MSLKDAYFARMASQFRRWDAELAVLIQKAAAMDDISRARFTRRLQPMRAHRDAAYHRLQRIRTASETSWRSLQSGVDSGWIAMKHAIAQAQER
jgi:hypothetical protein